MIIYKAFRLKITSNKISIRFFLHALYTTSSIIASPFCVFPNNGSAVIVTTTVSENYTPGYYHPATTTGPYYPAGNSSICLYTNKWHVTGSRCTPSSGYAPVTGYGTGTGYAYGTGRDRHTSTSTTTEFIYTTLPDPFFNSASSVTIEPASLVPAPTSLPSSAEGATLIYSKCLENCLYEFSARPKAQKRTPYCAATAAYVESLSDGTSSIDPRLFVYLEVSVHAFPHCWPTFSDDFNSYESQANNLGLYASVLLREDKGAREGQVIRRSSDEWQWRELLV